MINCFFSCKALNFDSGSSACPLLYKKYIIITASNLTNWDLFSIAINKVDFIIPTQRVPVNLIKTFYIFIYDIFKFNYKLLTLKIIKF